MKIKTTIFFCVLLSLTACGPSKEEMNKTLTSGCAAGIKYVLKHIDSDYSFVSPENVDISRSSGTATVKIEANVLYREFSEETENYECVFQETKNIMNYSADILYVDAEEDKYGRVDDNLTNLSIREFSTFNEAVRMATR